MDLNHKIKIYDKYASYPNIKNLIRFFAPKANIYLEKHSNPKLNLFLL